MFLCWCGPALCKVLSVLLPSHCRLGRDGAGAAEPALPSWFKVRPVMKLGCVVVFRSFVCSLPVACGVTHQVLESPRLGFTPKAELPFGNSYSALQFLFSSHLL